MTDEKEGRDVETPAVELDEALERGEAEEGSGAVGKVPGGDGEDRVGREGGGAVEELRSELESLNERHLRLAAEFDNYRKRNERDRQTLATRLQSDLIAALLDVLDDLQRVEETGEDTTVDAVVEGVRLVERKFMGVLEGAGLEEIEAAGSRFDPEVMEALMTVPTEDPEKDGHVADVFQRGYRFRDVLVRPARVRVHQYDGGGD